MVEIMVTVKNMIEKTDLDKLYSFFELPSIISNLLAKNRELEADEEYAIHDILCDMQPDSALIVIALCARNILPYVHNISSKKLLSHSAYVTGEYAQQWLDNACEENISGDVTNLQNLLMEIPEDLSIMSSMLTGCAASFVGKNNPVARICNALAIQAASHSDIAVAYLDAIDKSLEMRKPTEKMETEVKKSEIPIYNLNNVIFLNSPQYHI